jgi:hypothetical protein
MPIWTEMVLFLATSQIAFLSSRSPPTCRMTASRWASRPRPLRPWRSVEPGSRRQIGWTWLSRNMQSDVCMLQAPPWHVNAVVLHWCSSMHSQDYRPPLTAATMAPGRPGKAVQWGSMAKRKNAAIAFRNAPAGRWAATPAGHRAFKPLSA